jgi:hypothetical protein
MKIKAITLATLCIVFFAHVNAHATNETELEKQLLEESMRGEFHKPAAATHSKTKSESPAKQIKKEEKADPKKQKVTQAATPAKPKESKYSKKVDSLTIGKLKIKVGMLEADFMKAVPKKQIVLQTEKPDPKNPKNHFLQKECRIDKKEFAVVFARKSGQKTYRIISILTKK